MGGSQAPAGLPEAGRPFARFEVIRLVGRGAMATVCLARDPQRGEEVALKVYLSPADRKAQGLRGRCELDNARFRRRFLDPDGIPSRIRDLPGVVPILDAGVEGERFWYTMPHITAGDLGQRLRGGPMAPDDAVRLVARAARALHGVHEREVVHRDIKPENLLVGAGGELLLADFGMALLMKDGQRGEPLSTAPGEILGTPQYMSPEQASGQAWNADQRSDVYSLGAILYEALTGRNPHPGESASRVIESVLIRTPDPPSQRRPGVSPALDPICRRALEKTMTDRYPSAGAFADALDAYLRGERPAEVAPTARPKERGLLFRVLPIVAIVLVVLLVAWPSRSQDPTELVARAREELRARGNARGAELLLSRALTLSPSLKEALQLRAEARRAMGDEKGAIEDEKSAAGLK